MVAQQAAHSRVPVARTLSGSLSAVTETNALSRQRLIQKERQIADKAVTNSRALHIFYSPIPFRKQTLKMATENSRLSLQG
jgi:hypothetical protein